MALPESGAISLGEVNTELGLSATAQISLNDTDVRTLFGVASGAISLSNGYGKSAASSAKGFFAGGRFAPATRTTEIDGVDFATETNDHPSMTLSYSEDGYGASSSTTKGYTFSVAVPTNTITFATETRGVAGSGGFAYHRGSADSSTKGYIGLSTINLFNYAAMPYATETIEILAATQVYTSTRGGLAHATCGQSPVKGYYFGGAGRPGMTGELSPVRNDEISAILFSNETATGLAAKLPVATGANMATSSLTKSYVHGGYDGLVNVQANRISGHTFSTDTHAIVVASTPQGRGFGASAQSPEMGYYGGGTTNPTGNLNNYRKIDFTTETSSTPAATLRQTKTYLVGVYSGRTY